MFYFLPLNAQFRVTEQQSQVWLQYFNQTRLNKRWGIWLDGGVRTRQDLVKDVSQFLLRPSLIYYAGWNLRLVAGYAHFQQALVLNENVRWQKEHRIWQGLFWQSPEKKRGFTWFQSFRFEQRFRENVARGPATTDKYFFNYRVRYNVGFQYPLLRNLFAQISDEVMFNFGKTIIYNHFDQNRFQAGLRYRINDHNSIFAGYLNVYQKRAIPEAVQMTHVLRISYFQNLDLISTD